MRPHRQNEHRPTATPDRAGNAKRRTARRGDGPAIIMDAPPRAHATTTALQVRIAMRPHRQHGNGQTPFLTGNGKRRTWPRGRMPDPVGTFRETSAAPIRTSANRDNRPHTRMSTPAPHNQNRSHSPHQRARRRTTDASRCVPTTDAPTAHAGADPVAATMWNAFANATLGTCGRPCADVS